MSHYKDHKAKAMRILSHVAKHIKECHIDLESTVESFGFIMHDANLCEEAIDLYLIDKETEIAYDYFDLSYEDYNRFKRKDYLEYYDQRYSACCQADVDSKSVCEYCKKVITLWNWRTKF